MAARPHRSSPSPSPAPTTGHHHHRASPGDDAGSVKEDDKLTTGGKLDVTDKDAGEASFKPQTDFKGDHGKFSLDANGNWKYELDNNDPKVQALGGARS